MTATFPIGPCRSVPATRYRRRFTATNVPGSGMPNREAAPVTRRAPSWALPVRPTSSPARRTPGAASEFPRHPRVEAPARERVAYVVVDLLVRDVLDLERRREPRSDPHPVAGVVQVAGRQRLALGVRRVDEIRADKGEVVEDTAAPGLEHGAGAHFVLGPAREELAVGVAAADVARHLVGEIQAAVEARPEAEEKRQLDPRDARPVHVLGVHDVLGLREELDEILGDRLEERRLDLSQTQRAPGATTRRDDPEIGAATALGEEGRISHHRAALAEQLDEIGQPEEAAEVPLDGHAVPRPDPEADLPGHGAIPRQPRHQPAGVPRTVGSVERLIAP